MTNTLNPTTNEYDPTIAIDKDSLWEAVIGAGALGYSWYISAQIDWDRHLAKVSIETGEYNEPGATLVAMRTLTKTMLARVVVELIKDDQPTITAIDWSDPEADGDIDADVADVIMQTALLGKVVFG
jgi:hypothetical protein